MIPDPRIFKLHDSFNEKIFKFIDWGKYYFCFSPGVFFASGLVYSYKLLEYSVMLVIITYLTSSSEQINLTKASGLVMLYFIAHAEESDEIERRILFKIIGVLVTAVGEAGVMALLGDFIADQLRAREPKTNKNEDRVEARKTVWWRGAWCFSVITSFLIRNYSWADTFSFSAKATVITLIFFVGGTAWLHYCGKSAPAGSHKYDSHDVNVYQSRRPRLTDQAKVREPSTLRPQGQDMEGRLHSGKIFLNMIPMGSSFLVYGLVVSTAETFFPEQGEEMQLSSFFTILFVFQSVSSKSISYLFSYFLDSEWVPEDKRKEAKLVRIWFGMVLTIFCCFVAERVEVHRLIVVNKEGFLDKPDQIIPMSIFWLVPTVLPIRSYERNC
ncbi:hypothetical protein Patl1_14596 [Pistacia atlantica]|uniref:Uncharacterized protein n=1 Tax=Pistacia atlantica TaxID=434234 RepID=A0ACC1AT56_9ROSI|nr:hypothetical protein Patl1_14596 [Pistacia atlantica]